MLGAGTPPLLQESCSQPPSQSQSVRSTEGTGLPGEGGGCLVAQQEAALNRPWTGVCPVGARAPTVKPGAWEPESWAGVLAWPPSSLHLHRPPLMGRSHVPARAEYPRCARTLGLVQMRN